MASFHVCISACAQPPTPPPHPPHPPHPPQPTPPSALAASLSPTQAAQEGVRALLEWEETRLPSELLTCMPCQNPTQCGRNDQYYCDTCGFLFHDCVAFMWNSFYMSCGGEGYNKRLCKNVLAPLWLDLSQRLRGCRKAVTRTVACPVDKWGV